jgi:hypothetical protein
MTEKLIEQWEISSTDRGLKELLAVKTGTAKIRPGLADDVNGTQPARDGQVREALNQTLGH